MENGMCQYPSCQREAEYRCVRTFENYPTEGMSCFVSLRFCSRHKELFYDTFDKVVKIDNGVI